MAGGRPKVAYILHRIFASCFTILLLLSAPDILSLAQAEEEVPIPFRVVWNYPDKPCFNRHLNPEVENYGIVRNPNVEFVGDQIATLYVSGSQHGLWPQIVNGNVSVNGGIPQLVNLTAHLWQIQHSIADRISPDADGYGVLDLEIWRPMLRLNWGNYRVYVEASTDLARQYHPNMTDSELKEEAALEWDTSARLLMEQSITVLRAAWPKVHWGYYSYPHLWSENVGRESTNNEMDWLYRIVNGFYPSIYIKNVQTMSPEQKETKVKDVLTEAMRVKLRDGQPGSIIAAYSMVQNDQIYFNESDLYYAIGLSADMGLDAVILWGASSFLHNHGCENIHNYVNSTLGPYVMSLTERLTNCSRDRCSGRGRCVRKDFAETYPYILSTSPEIPIERRQLHDVIGAKSTVPPTPVNHFPSPQQGISADGFLNSISTTPGTSYTLPVSTATYHSDATLNSMNTTSLQTHVTNVTQNQESVTIQSITSVTMDTVTLLTTDTSKPLATNTASTFTSDGETSNKPSSMPTVTTAHQSVGTTDSTYAHTPLATQESTTATPESTSTPHQITSGPSGSTTVPHESISGPSESTTAPHESTSGPSESTTAPHENTSGPYESTTAPHESTSGPYESTTAPHESTSVPLGSTSTQPDYDEYEDYVCQCYNGWDGPTCEDLIERP